MCKTTNATVILLIYVFVNVTFAAGENNGDDNQVRKTTGFD